MSTTLARMYLVALNAPAGEKGQGTARIEMRDGHGSVEVNAKDLSPHGNGDYHVIVIYEGGLFDAGVLRHSVPHHLNAPLSGIRKDILGVMVVLMSNKGSLHVILRGLVRGQKPQLLQWAEEQARMRWGMGAALPQRPEPVPTAQSVHKLSAATLHGAMSESTVPVSAPIEPAEPASALIESVEPASAPIEPANPATADEDIKIWGKAMQVSAAPECAQAQPVMRPYTMPASKNMPFPAYPLHERMQETMSMEEPTIGRHITLGDLILDSQLMHQTPLNNDILMQPTPRYRREDERGDDDDAVRAPGEVETGKTPPRYDIRTYHLESSEIPRRIQDEPENPFDRLRRGRPSNRQFVPNPFPALYPNTRWVMVQYPGMRAPHYLAGEVLLDGHKLWAAAVPGEFDTTPPPWLPGFLKYRKVQGGQGYWVALQDPVTGEFFHDDR